MDDAQYLLDEMPPGKLQAGQTFGLDILGHGTTEQGCNNFLGYVLLDETVVAASLLCKECIVSLNSLEAFCAIFLVPKI